MAYWDDYRGERAIPQAWRLHLEVAHLKAFSCMQFYATVGWGGTSIPRNDTANGIVTIILVKPILHIYHIKTRRLQTAGFKSVDAEEDLKGLLVVRSWDRTSRHGSIHSRTWDRLLVGFCQVARRKLHRSKY